MTYYLLPKIYKRSPHYGPHPMHNVVTTFEVPMLLIALLWKKCYGKNVTMNLLAVDKSKT